MAGIVRSSTGALIAVGDAFPIIPPAGLVWSPDDVLARLRIDNLEEEYVSLTQIIAAATGYVEHYTGLGLLTQTWAQRWSGWPPVMTLEKRPVQAVVSVNDLTQTGSPTVALDPSGYTVAGLGAPNGFATIRPATGSWPSFSAAPSQQEMVEVIYRVGFGDQPSDIPASLRQTVMDLVGLWFRDREGTDVSLINLLLREWRPLGVA